MHVLRNGSVISESHIYFLTTSFLHTCAYNAGMAVDSSGMASYSSFQGSSSTLAKIENLALRE